MAYFFNKLNRVLSHAQWTRIHLGESFLRIKHVLRIIRIKSFFRGEVDVRCSVYKKTDDFGQLRFL